MFIVFIVIKMYRDKTKRKYYPPGGKPTGFHHPMEPRGMYRPLMSMSKESFKEMRTYFVLKILTDNLDGITGYQLQEDYHFPRTNVLRLLDDLVEQKYVKTKTDTVDGRANKLYIITDKGMDYMNELKEKWAERFTMMSDTTMPFFSKGERFMLKKSIDKFTSTEDAVDYFRGIRSRVKSKQTVLQDRLDVYNKLKDKLDELIDDLEKSDKLDKEALEKQIDEFWESYRK